MRTSSAAKAFAGGFALLLSGVLLAGCGPVPDPGAVAPGLDARADVVSGVQRSDAAAALLPASIRDSGELRIGRSVGGAPPSAFYLEDNRTAVGLDVDIAEAVARKLGLRLDAQEAAFDTILPALGSGKYDAGTGNFGVTEERKKTIDFATYVQDGQGFAVRAGDPGGPITDVTRLCGRTVGTTKGTTFEATLTAHAHRCAEIGEPAYQVQVFSESSALYSALAQRKIDVIMGAVNGLRYAATQQPALELRNEFRRLDVGFALAKGSPLAPALRAAVNELIHDGGYARILAKWGVTPSAIPESQVSPPEIH
ncbi:ABC transporter substrate-binding protein [Saccharopolyspora gloriosae]|uniref:Polar amino acid transport system substrate-binding protein n=1 Tax=Saccharopolyspora gloriosae TaxID=455344 RepID=A0A840NEW7_9PSEU|nr:ABC transporter substrate-binding protein [Saccharopolyspora gloriosae]MBB5067752.1 polar amino acid transport system substrate-binding protein [Saccharopolyspora gloriosae]